MTNRLETPEYRVFSRFLIAHAKLMREFDATLREVCDIPLSWFDVLVHVSLEPGQRVTHTRLGERTLMSQGGVTRLVDRMVKAGLVARRASRADRRKSYVVLTDSGREKLAEAMPTQLDSIQELFVQHLEDGDTEVMDGFFRRVLGLE